MCFVMLASFVELVLTGAARGTAYNTGYDLGLASCIGTGIILARLNDTNERYIRADDLIMFAIVIRIFIGLIPQFSERALSVEARTSLMRENEQVTKIINVLASVKGLVACVHLSFCYWAGKRSRIDLFMQPAVFFRPPRNPANIRRGIESRMFAAVEYIAAAPPELGILANYQPIHVADPSVIDSVVAIPIAPLGAK